MYVYALGDPRTQQVHYIGQAKNVYRRFAQHLNEPHRNKGKDTWMDDIKAAGIVPTLAILESNIDPSVIDERERYWIKRHLAQGAPLTNIAHGPRAGQEFETDYVTAHDAAQILSLKHDRPIRVDYISKMAKSKKHAIRVARFRDRIMYHRADIEACNLGSSKARVAR